MHHIIITILQLLKRPYYLLKRSVVPLNSRICGDTLLINSKIGKYCYIGRGGVINSCISGNYCSIAPNVIIGGMEHSYWAPSTSTQLCGELCISGKITKIGNDVWIGANCVIRQGITIGNGAVIGAGSVVLKDVPANTIVAGVPAKFIKKRMDDDKWQRVKESNYWMHEPSTAKQIISTIK